MSDRKEVVLVIALRSTQSRFVQAARVLFYVVAVLWLSVFLLSLIADSGDWATRDALNLVKIAGAGVLAISYALYAGSSIRFLAARTHSIDTSKWLRSARWLCLAIFVGVPLCAVVFVLAAIADVDPNTKVLLVFPVILSAGPVIIAWALLVSTHDIVKKAYRKQVSL